MNGNKRARPRFLLLPERISAAALSVLLSSAGEGLSFAIIKTIYTIGWFCPHLHNLRFFDQWRIISRLLDVSDTLKMIIPLKEPSPEGMGKGCPLSPATIFDGDMYNLATNLEALFSSMYIISILCQQILHPNCTQIAPELHPLGTTV
jgi:hypothetical protein